MSTIKENRTYLLMLIGILFVFFLGSFFLSKSRTSPSYFSKFTSAVVKYVNPSVEPIINDTSKYYLKLNTNKGNITIELDPNLGYYNVQNVYLFSKEKAFDNSNITYTSSINTFNLSAKDTLKRSVLTEINFVSLKLNEEKIKVLNDKRIYSDDSYVSKTFNKYNFGVKIDTENYTRNQFFITNSDNKALDGDNVNIGKITSGMEILDTLVTSKEKLIINSSSISVKQ